MGSFVIISGGKVIRVNGTSWQKRFYIKLIICPWKHLSPCNLTIVASRLIHRFWRSFCKLFFLFIFKLFLSRQLLFISHDILVWIESEWSIYCLECKVFHWDIHLFEGSGVVYKSIFKFAITVETALITNSKELIPIISNAIIDDITKEAWYKSTSNSGRWSN